MKVLKSFIYGFIPYFFLKSFKIQSPNIQFYEYIKNYGYSRHLFLFRHEYQNFKVDVLFDESKNLHYVVHNDKKLYFHNGLTTEKIERMYKALIMEQDVRSAHHYLDSLDEVNGKTFLDIGSAEGLTSLDVIDIVDKVYLFECDNGWIEALKATFEPWKKKVCIVNKYINSFDDDKNQTLDDFFKDMSKDNLFLKMDIEGFEREALAGSTNLFSTAKDFSYAICAYHLPDDEKVISSFLNQCNSLYNLQRGYFDHKYRSIVFRSIKR
ncbi:MAG: FkbM family methyltransferase [Bacteroidales bacterium]|nr:FkbM family methyltransferase [Bacteroidales bacterium]